MAHWIVEGPGFDGQYYKCSKCGDSRYDIHNEYLYVDHCPSCGTPINHDETEYVNKTTEKTHPVIPELHIGSWKIDKSGWYFRGSGKDDDEI